MHYTGFIHSICGFIMTVVLGGNHLNTLDQYLNQLIQKNHYTGFVVLVDRPNKPIWLKAYGVSDREKNIKTKASDLYRIASSTKPFIATLVIKLAMNNQLKLGDKLSDYLGEKYLHNIENAKQVTIKQLLSMQSGLYNYTDNPKFTTYVHQHPNHHWTALDALAFARNMPAVSAPGKSNEYSNTNYILLGLVVEKVTGHSLVTELQTKIFDPLNLKHTYLEKHQTIPYSIVPGYVYDKGQNKNISMINDGHGLADGGIVSNAEDLNHFIRSLMLDNHFMPEKWRKQMMVFHPIKSTDGVEYGLGLVRFPSKYGDLIGHDGSDQGYQSWMMFMPASKTSIIILVNNNPPHLSLKKLLAAVFG